MSVTTLTYRAATGGHPVDLDRLVASRMLVQANSGGGKSRAVRQLLEETSGRVQHLVIDPEGEFATLREAFPYVLAAKTGGDVLASPKTAKLLCRRLVELGASAVLDLYELSLPERREFVKVFLTELVNLPRSLWRPIIVVIDEAHMFAPERGSGESQSTDAVISLCTLGRKRGLCAVLATQRISKLHKDAAAELLNKMIGRTGLDVDVKRAADELGFDKEARQKLPRLEPGEFFVYGPAISPAVTLVRTGEVCTTHPEPGQVSAAPPAPPSKVKAMLAQLVDLPKEAEQEAKTVAELERTVKQLRGDLSRAQRTGVEKIVEKVVPDERATARAVATALKPWQEKDAKVIRLVQRVGGAHRTLVEALNVLADTVGTTTIFEAPAPISAPERLPVATLRPQPTTTKQAPPVVNGEGREAIPRPQLKVLDAIADLNALGIERPSRGNVGAWLGISASTGSFKNYLGALRTNGLIEYPSDGLLQLTDAGAAVAQTGNGPQTLDELHRTWLDRLPGPQARVLEIVLGEGQTPISRADIAVALNVSHETGSFKNYLGALRSLGLIDYPSDGMVAATDLLFPDGLS